MMTDPCRRGKTVRPRTRCAFAHDREALYLLGRTLAFSCSELTCGLSVRVVLAHLVSQRVWTGFREPCRSSRRAVPPFSPFRHVHSCTPAPLFSGQGPYPGKWIQMDQI